MNVTDISFQKMFTEIDVHSQGKSGRQVLDLEVTKRMS